jgi:hypothetical protein
MFDQELYLRKNYITDITEIQYLTGLRDLRVLWLCDNPCADHPLYRQLVAYALPGGPGAGVRGSWGKGAAHMGMS